MNTGNLYMFIVCANQTENPRMQELKGNIGEIGESMEWMKIGEKLRAIL